MCPSRSSAQVVGVEGAARSRVSGLVAGGEPLLALCGRAVGELRCVHPAVPEVCLDVVVTDLACGVQCVVEISLGDVADQNLTVTAGHRGGVVGPHPGIAIGL